MIYVRFLLSLAFGLAGVCLVLTTLLDTLLADWDVYSDLRAVLGRPARWKYGLRSGYGEDRVATLVTRLQSHEAEGPS